MSVEFSQLVCVWKPGDRSPVEVHRLIEVSRPGATMNDGRDWQISFPLLCYSFNKIRDLEKDTFGKKCLRCPEFRQEYVEVGGQGMWGGS